MNMKLIIALITGLILIPVFGQETRSFDKAKIAKQLKKYPVASPKSLESRPIGKPTSKSKSTNKERPAMKFNDYKSIENLVNSKEFLFATAKDFTLKQAVNDSRKALAPKTLKQLNWIPQRLAYSYVKQDRICDVLIGVYPTKEDSVLLRLKDLNDNIIEAYNWEALKHFPALTWVDSKTIFFKHENHYLEYEIGNGLTKVLAYDEAAANHDYLPKHKLLAFTVEQDLFIKNGEALIEVAKSDKDGLMFGQAVHRYEFGISKGTFWSPKAKQLAFYKKDESMVTDYPLLQLNTQPANAEMIKYPMAGKTSHQVEVGIYNLAAKSTVYLKLNGKEDFYKTNISWNADGQSIFVALINRGQDYVRLNEYNASTGNYIRTVWEERSEKYVEPETPLIHIKDQDYLWLSEKKGYNQFYLIKDGKLSKQLLKSEINVNHVLGITSSKKFVLFEGQGEDAINQYIYKMHLGSGKVSVVTKAEGWHKGKFHVEQNMLIDEYSSIEVPRVIQTIDIDTKSTENILTASNPLKNYRWAKAEISTINNDDNKLYTRMIKPSDFDSSKKYPALVYVYNGPHVQLVKNSWLGGAPMWMHWMAEQGYIVFTIDGRGSKGRSIEFEQAVHRQLGTLEMEDQIAGVKHLISLPYIDGDRLAVHGWSFGGFMTTSLMLRYPGIFKVGVAGGPVIDWDMYEIMYTERYMDTPEENQEGYDKARLYQYIPNLEGDLLMIHGVVDDVVLMQHSLEFVKQCVDAGVQMDYFVYPGHPHNVRGKDRVHLMEKVLKYVMDHL